MNMKYEMFESVTDFMFCMFSFVDIRDRRNFAQSIESKVSRLFTRFLVYHVYGEISLSPEELQRHVLLLLTFQRKGHTNQKIWREN